MLGLRWTKTQSGEYVIEMPPAIVCHVSPADPSSPVAYADFMIWRSNGDELRWRLTGAPVVNGTRANQTDPQFLILLASLVVWGVYALSQAGKRW